MLWHIVIVSLVATCNGAELNGQVITEGDDTFSMAVGQIGSGGNIGDREVMSVEEAVRKCASLPNCQGFSMKAGKPSLEPSCSFVEAKGLYLTGDLADSSKFDSIEDATSHCNTLGGDICLGVTCTQNGTDCMLYKGDDLKPSPHDQVSFTKECIPSVGATKGIVIFKNKFDLTNKLAKGWTSYKKRPRHEHVAQGMFAIGNFSKGILSRGGDIYINQMTIHAAVKKCQSLPDCSGFTINELEQPPLDKIVTVYFKNRWELVEDREDWISYRNLMVKPKTAVYSWKDTQKRPLVVTPVGRGGPKFRLKSSSSHQEETQAQETRKPTEKKDLHANHEYDKRTAQARKAFWERGRKKSQGALSDMMEALPLGKPQESKKSMAWGPQGFLQQEPKQEDSLLSSLLPLILGLGALTLLALVGTRLIGKMRLSYSKRDDDHWDVKLRRMPLIQQALALFVAPEGRRRADRDELALDQEYSTAPKAHHNELMSAIIEQSEEAAASQRKEPGPLSQVIDQACNDNGL